jgi:nucleotide-binding universal stress UspA family protein
MKTILFPTDFSANALHASQYAGMLAKSFNANVVLLNVHTIPSVSEYQLPYEIDSLIKFNQKKAEDNLRDFAVHFLQITHLAADRVSQKVEYGFPNEKITETAETIHADMIVMGTKGANNLFDKWLGTHSQEVMKEAKCPVWIIPKNAPINYPQNILYAADFKEDEVVATQKVLSFCSPLGAKCKVVHVHDYFEINVGHSIEEMVKYLENEFENVDDVSFINLKRANIIEGLETYIKTHKPDVLAMALSEKSFFEKLFDSSITKHFVQGSHLPMLIFKK